MPKVSELVSSNVGSAITNVNTWGNLAVNVKSYGAVGDGVADDTIAIQAAIAYAISLGKVEVYFPAGTYKYGVLTSTAGLTFIGDGVTLNGTTAITLTSIAALQADVTQRAINVMSAPYNAKGDGVTDDTTAIQAALNAVNAAGGGTVFIPYGIFIVNPLTLTSFNNVVIEFASGAILRAKTGYVEGQCILTIANSNNIKIMGNYATVQMLKAEYTTGEQRHAVSIASSNNVAIYDLHSIDSGGDGFIISSSDTVTPCKDILIQNCYANNNRRQGMSIVSAINVTVIGGRYSNTTGTAPSFGIDIEPDTPDDFIQNINIIGVTTEGNLGGIQIVPGYLATGSGTQNPVSINITDCISKNDGASGGLRFAYPDPTPSLPENYIYGQIVVENMLIISPAGRGVDVARWNVKSPKATLKNVKVINPYSTLSTGALDDQCGFVIHNFTTDTMSASGNIDFINCGAEDTRGTPLMQIPFYFHTDDSTKPIDNVLVVDPYGINQANVSNGYINWNYGSGLVKYTNPPTKSFGASSGAINHFGYLLTASTSLVITLPNSNDIIGIEYLVRNNAGETLQIRPTATDTIMQAGLSLGNDVVLRVAGDYIKIKSIGNNQWIVMDYEGSGSPLGFQAIPTVLYGTAAPTTLTWAIGDIVYNKAPTELGTAGSKYVILGWVCIGVGTPGTWLPMRSLTGN